MNIVLKKTIGNGLGLTHAIIEVNGKRYKKTIFSDRDGTKYFTHKIDGFFSATIYLNEWHNNTLKERWRATYIVDNKCIKIIGDDKND